MTSEDSLPSPDHNSRSVSDDEYDALVPPYVANGVIGAPGDADLIYGDSSGRVVKIRINRSALVRARLWTSASTAASLAIAANSSGSTRFDLVVLRYTRATYNVRATVITGAPGSGVPSPLNNATYFDMPLANVQVGNGATVIDDTDVTVMNWYIGPQQLVCTSTTRPPHAENTIIYEDDTGRLLFSNGAAWLILYDNTGRVNVTVATGWTALLKTVQRINGVAWLSLEMDRTGGTIAINTDTTIAIIPANYKPAVQINMTAMVLGGSKPVRCLITTAGSVVITDFGTAIVNGDTLSVDSISWPVGG